MTRAKDNEAFSLDALRKEAKGEVQPFKLVVDGKTYVMPAPKDLDIDSLSEWASISAGGDAPEASAITAGLKALLGDDYEAVRAYKITVSEAAAIFEAWAAHYGLNSAGESSASSSS